MLLHQNDIRCLTNMTYLMADRRFIAAQMEMREGLLSKKLNGHTIITLEEINRLTTVLEMDTLEILKQTYPDPTE